MPTAFGATAGRATFLGDGATPGSFFGTPWRLAEGGLLDLGPHVLDALDTALGQIVAIEAAGDPLGIVALTCEHSRRRDQPGHDLGDDTEPGRRVGPRADRTAGLSGARHRARRRRRRRWPTSGLRW